MSSTPKTLSSYWVLVFLFYFLTHAMIRAAMGWKLTVDEIDLIRNSISFEFLYNGEMPLYTWLQISVFDLFGQTIFAMTLLKNAIMLMITMSIFTLVQKASNREFAFAAAASLLFVPQFIWTSQHSLTAPVLATLFAATSLLAFYRLWEGVTLRRYLMLGAMLGLGAISSTSFLVVPVALVGAALLSKKTRGLILNKFFLATIVVAVAVAIRPYQELVSTTVLPLGMDLTTTSIYQRVIDLYATLQTVLTFLSLLIVGTTIIVYSGLGEARSTPQPLLHLREFILKMSFIGVSLIFAYAFLEGGQEISKATIQPVLFMVAPLIALYIYPVMSQPSFKNARNLSGAIAVLILIVTPMYFSFDKGTGSSSLQAAATDWSENESVAN